MLCLFSIVVVSGNQAKLLGMQIANMQFDWNF